MEYYDFNKTMQRGDTTELLRMAGNCHQQQQHIEDEIEQLKAKLRQNQDFERQLRAKANA